MFAIDEPYYNTKQNLVKERHNYANALAGGLNNHQKASIKITIKGETKEIESYKAAEWLDKFFFNLINKKLARRIDKWAFDKINLSYLTLEDIKNKVEIKVEREEDVIKLFDV